MNTLIDLMGSFIIGGLVLLMGLNFGLFSSEVKHGSDAELQVQGNAAAIAEMLDYDLRKVGFNYDGVAVLEALPKRFSFLGDVDSNGVVDQVTYFMGDSTEVPSTENPRDRMLYCVINGDTLGRPALGLVDIKFTYHTVNGTVTTVPAQVKYVEAEIWVESPYKIKNEINGNYEYLFTYWEMKISPRNI